MRPIQGYYCPVCGRWVKSVKDFLKPRKSHVCPSAVLNGIDAADSREWNKELDPLRQSPAPLWRTPIRRLREGFDMLSDDEEPTP